MLQLDDVTLCAVASRAPHLALRSLRASMCQVGFGDVLLFAPADFESEVPDSIRWVKIPVFASVEGYSRFVLTELAEYVFTTHVLIVQWDGFILDPTAWEPAFLHYDYIGATWPQFDAKVSVGNGGFSLRSRRLLQACIDPRFVLSHPEDICICHRNRDFLITEYGIAFAPPEIAAFFSYERALVEFPTFGFHGLFTLPDFMDAKELLAFLAEVPVDMLGGRDSHDLCRRLIQSGRLEHLPTVIMLMKGILSAGQCSPLWRVRLQLEYGWFRAKATTLLAVFLR